MVEEDYQGLGIASRLLPHLVQIVRQKNFARFEATGLAGNQSMLRVFAASGLAMQQRRDGTVVEVTLLFDETASQG